MANTKSAKKAARQAVRRTEVNKSRKTRAHTVVRKVEEAIATGDKTAAAAALKVADRAPPGSVILAMLPDTGERYLSTPLFADVPADMTPAELEISQSTPSCQLPKAG